MLYERYIRWLICAPIQVMQGVSASGVNDIMQVSNAASAREAGAPHVAFRVDCSNQLLDPQPHASPLNPYPVMLGLAGGFRSQTTSAKNVIRGFNRSQGRWHEV